MSLEYIVNGCVPVRDAPELEAEVVELVRALDIDEGQVTLETIDGERVLFLDICTYSSWATDRIDELIPAFAAKWARGPATLDTECEGDEEEWIVGPEGFDPVAAELANIDAEIAHLQQRRAALVAQQTTKEG